MMLARTIARCKRAARRTINRARGWWGSGVDPALAARVEQAVAEARRVGPIGDNGELLLGLHEWFPRREGTLNYDRQSLLDRARGRFARWRKHGIPLANMALLDLAAGHGENLFVAREFGLKSATAVDFSAARFRELVPSFPADVTRDLEYIETDLNTVELVSERYDLIVSDNSFQLFERPEALVHQCYRALRPGGWFVAEFGPLFHSPWGGHRYGVTGVPYFQNVFSDETVYEFLYHRIGFGPEVHRYSGAPLVKKDPYAELNRWSAARFESLFRGDDRWRVVDLARGYDFSQMWLTRVFQNEMGRLGRREPFVASMYVTLRKR
jgi:ubiquinone/menaquinone biosynthesis C-methylase UbiE